MDANESKSPWKSKVDTALRFNFLLYDHLKESRTHMSLSSFCCPKYQTKKHEFYMVGSGFQSPPGLHCWVTGNPERKNLIASWHSERGSPHPKVYWVFLVPIQFDVQIYPALLITYKHSWPQIYCFPLTKNQHIWLYSWIYGIETSPKGNQHLKKHDKIVANLLSTSHWMAWYICSLFAILLFLERGVTILATPKKCTTKRNIPSKLHHKKTCLCIKSWISLQY